MTLNEQNDFNPRSYWENRLADKFDLTGVGFRRKSVAYNKWVYRVRTELLDNLFRENGWAIEGKSALDVGCGTGYFIEHWLSRGAANVTGMDIAQISIERLRERYPSVSFHLADLSDPGFRLESQFDYVSIFDVLFHIIDNNRFVNVAGNLAKVCRPGARVFITDVFGRKSFAGARHCHNRSLSYYVDVFSRYGFKLRSMTPLFYTLLPPSGISNPVLRWIGILAWEAMTFVTRWNFFGNIIGATLYGIDSRLRKLFNHGPGGYLAVFEYEVANE